MKIYIFTQEQVCKICDGKRHGICDCCSWKQLPHTTTEKALKKMREAVKPFEDGYEEITHIEEALEAALRALVEGK